MPRRKGKTTAKAARRPPRPEAGGDVEGEVLRFLQKEAGPRRLGPIRAALKGRVPGATPARVESALRRLEGQGSILPGADLEGAYFEAPTSLSEPPTAHLVCRHCGRVGRMVLTSLAESQLLEMATLKPEGWRIERLSTSLVGSCPACRRSEDRHRV